MALKPWLLSCLIKDSEKLCSILTRRLVPAGPPFTPWVLLILSSSALTGFPHGLHQTVAERACPCKRISLNLICSLQTVEGKVH